MMKRVGRPLKYYDDNIRNETRRIQNRENQRKCRKRKNLRKEINSFNTLPINKDNDYRINLMNFFKQFDFNYFFTGTIDPNYVENEKNTTSNQTIETNFNPFEVRKIGIKSLRRYTEKFVDHLIDLNLIERCFVVFEVGNFGTYHIHILFGSNKNVIDFHKTLNTKWLLGNTKTEPILTDVDKYNLLKYCTKELTPSSNNKQDINKIDNWFFSGNFKNEIKRSNIL